jgi:phosphatidylglycerophosphatase GEP4
MKYIFKLNSVIPDIRANSICDLNLNLLKEKNKINFIVFDKDNTLTLPHKNTLANESISKKIKEFKLVFGDRNVAILSNSAGSRDDKDYREAKEIEENTGMAVIKHEYKKPKVFREILETFKIEEGRNKEICVIGDRLLVDVVMGKEYGMFTILVDPITRDKDNFIVKLLRKFENLLLKNKNI